MEHDAPTLLSKKVLRQTEMNEMNGLIHFTKLLTVRVALKPEPQNFKDAVRLGLDRRGWPTAGVVAIHAFS